MTIADTRSEYDRAEEVIDDLRASVARGDSVSAMAERHGLRREAIATVLNQNGIGRSSPAREQVLAYVRANPGLSVDDLSLRLDISKSSISRYLRGTPEHKLVVARKQSSLNQFTDTEMFAALRRAYRSLGEDRGKGLSRVKYNKIRSEDEPAASTFIRRFGEWSTACSLAGISAAPARRTNYKFTFSEEDLVASVREFVETTGELSYHQYAAWAMENNKPSGPLIVTRIGSWSTARKMVIEAQQRDAA